MVKVKPEHQIKINKAVLSQILSKYGITDFTYEVFKLGIVNTSIKIITRQKTYVLRVNRFGRKPDQEVLVEIAFQDVLRQNNFPIPAIYRDRAGHQLSHCDINGRVWQILLMEYSEGNNADDYSGELLTELAQLQARMHLLGIEFAKKQKIHHKIVDELTGYETVALALDDSKVKAFMEQFRQTRLKLDPNLPRGYNHLDLDFEGNVLVKDNHISAILDFDDLCFSACIICLGYTIWHIIFTTNSWEKVHFYLDQYQKIRPLTSLELKILPGVISFRNHMIGEILLSLWQDRERVNRTIELENQIQQHLFI